MTDNKLPTFSFPAVSGKQVTAAFDGGRLTSDGGVMLLAMAERRLGIAERLAHCFPDRRDPLRITHTLAEMVRARILAIACGYEDPDDLDSLRVGPAFKLACGRLPDTGANLCSQPTLSRLENAPSLKDAMFRPWTIHRGLRSSAVRSSAPRAGVASFRYWPSPTCAVVSRIRRRRAPSRGSLVTAGAAINQRRCDRQ